MDYDKHDGAKESSRDRRGDHDRREDRADSRYRHHSRSRLEQDDRERTSPSREMDKRDRERDREREKEMRPRRHDRDRSRSYSPSRRHEGRERERDRERDRERHHHSKHRRRRSHSSDDSSDDDSASSESEGERRRRKRKEKERRRDREDKEERRRRKEKKRAKKEKKLKNTAASTASWGKYGIISDIDLPKKDSEFRAWLVEERKINPETVSKDRTRKEFAIFVEDFNTATLPHDKYYDMGKYMIKLDLMRSGGTLPDESAGYDPMADMKAHSSSLKQATKEPEVYLSQQELNDLRRIEAERTEISKRRLLGMNVPKNMGVRTEDADY